MSKMLVVTVDIPFGDPGRGVYAYRVGDKVSEDAVKDNKWQDYVSAENTQAAKAAADAKGN
jgi:hypothetical protein